MASAKQVEAAKRNVKKAISAAKRKKTITHLPKAVRQDLGRQAAKARLRKAGAISGHAYEDRTRPELYEIAKKKNIAGRSKMGKWDLIKAIRKAS